MKTYTSFAIGDMIMDGWGLFRKHWLFIILAGIVTAIISIVLNLLQSPQTGLGNITWLFVVVTIIVILIRILITLGWSNVFLGMIRNHPIHPKSFLFRPRVFLSSIKSYILLGLYVLGALIAAVIPFIILFIIGNLTDAYALITVAAALGALALIVVACYFRIRYQFLPFTLLDYPELSARETLKKTASVTKGNIFQLLGFGAVVIITHLVGIIPLGLGLIITLPVSKIARARVYQYLKDQQI